MIWDGVCGQEEVKVGSENGGTQPGFSLAECI